MNMKSIVTGAVATLALVGCQKAADNISNEIDKGVTGSQLAGRWANDCKSTGTAWGLVGIKGERIVFDFFGDAGKTTQLYSTENCADGSMVGQATYTGTANIGNPTGPDESNILDLNYLNVSVMISDQGTVDTLNNPAVPACGINDWKVNEAREVTQVAGDVNCPITKPAQVFDIVKTNGTELSVSKRLATIRRLKKLAR